MQTFNDLSTPQQCRTSFKRKLTFTTTDAELDKIRHVTAGQWVQTFPKNKMANTLKGLDLAYSEAVGHGTGTELTATSALALFDELEPTTKSVMLKRPVPAIAQGFL